MKNLAFYSLIILFLTGCNLLPQVEEEKSITIEATCVNGTITPSKIIISKGDSVIFTVTPDDGYFVEEILVDQKSIEVPMENTFSVSDISSNRNVSPPTIKYACGICKIEISEEKMILIYNNGVGENGQNVKYIFINYGYK